MWVRNTEKAVTYITEHHTIKSARRKWPESESVALILPKLAH